MAKHRVVVLKIVAKQLSVTEAAEQYGLSRRQRHRTERRALHADIFGTEQVRRQPLRYEFTHPDREAANANRTAAIAAALRGMSVQDAAARITAQREAAQRARLARETRARQLHASHDLLSQSRHRASPRNDVPRL